MQVLWELPFRYAGAGARELHVLVSYNEAGDQAELLTMRAANPKPRFVQPVACTQAPLQRFEERAKHGCHVTTTRLGERLLFLRIFQEVHRGANYTSRSLYFHPDKPPPQVGVHPIAGACRSHLASWQAVSFCNQLADSTRASTPSH